MAKPVVAILKGEFDPVYRGDVDIAIQILRCTDAIQVWMIPTGRENLDHRLTMIDLATHENPRIRAHADTLGESDTDMYFRFCQATVGPGNVITYDNDRKFSYKPSFRLSGEQVRSMIESNHKKVPYLIHPEVLAYIREYRLYQLTPS